MCISEALDRMAAVTADLRPLALHILGLLSPRWACPVTPEALEEVGEEAGLGRVTVGGFQAPSGPMKGCPGVCSPELFQGGLWRRVGFLGVHMDEAAWRATVQGIARVRYDLVTEPPPYLPNALNKRTLAISFLLSL